MLFIAMLDVIKPNQNPKENGGTKRRYSLLGFMFYAKLALL
jgi:hypothetical protein